MKLRLVAVGVLSLSMLALTGEVAGAQTPAAESRAKGDISGDWQGTLTPPSGKSLRVIARISKADKGFTAKFYSIDQGGQAIPVNSVTLEGSTVAMKIDMIGGGYTGALSADGASIVGTWDQGSSMPLTLVRATKETAWEIPAPAPPPKMMPADADPAFDVATIKPNDSGHASMDGIGFNARNLIARNASLVDLISFAYDVQVKQVAGGPDWINKDRYDITATPDTPGLPTVTQMKTMVQKLLADRFKLTFHKDKREMSAYVLTVAKTGTKLKPTEIAGPGPGFGLQPKPNGVSMPVRNATMTEFTNVLQMMVLDRPVVNETALKDHYDFVLTFMPDDSQFNGHAPQINGQAPKADAADAFPSLYAAIQEQLGLKLEAQKTAVEVIAIDHVDKPSAN